MTCPKAPGQCLITSILQPRTKGEPVSQLLWEHVSITSLLSHNLARSGGRLGVLPLKRTLRRDMGYGTVVTTYIYR